jgi:peptide subunit release factor 1 (eRF1)
MLSFLANLPEQTAGATTMYLSPELNRTEIMSRLQLVSGDEAGGIAEIVANSKTGACLFWGEEKTLIIPPFPMKDNVVMTGYVKNPLITLLTADKMIAVILIRLGAYGIGLCRNESLIASKVGTGLIHGRHRQGGSSAQRFRRHREKQIEQFLSRVCERINEYLAPEIKNVDYAVFGGAKTTIELLKRRCGILDSLDNRLLPPLLDIVDPRQYVLEAAVRRIWSSRVIRWEEVAGT